MKVYKIYIFSNIMLMNKKGDSYWKIDLWM